MGIVNSLVRFAFGVAALFFASGAMADSSDLKVDLVVDVTDAGSKIPPATPEHPAYYYPVVRGYSPRGAVLPYQKPPPPLADVERLIAKELAKQGYWLATKQAPPSLLLMFWWGYKAPQMDDEQVEPSYTTRGMNMSQFIVDMHDSQKVAEDITQQVTQEIQNGTINSNQSLNGNEMEELVFGSRYEAELAVQWKANAREATLRQESRIARYYVIISALDFNAAVRERKIVVLWTARVSTSVWGCNLDEVLPALVAKMAPMLGRDTNGPEITSVPAVPLGRVEVGAPYVKVDLVKPAIPPKQ